MTDQVQAARHLGHPFGVNADVMNVALRNAGILEGDLVKARQWHRKLFALSKNMLTLATNPIPIKAAMAMLDMASEELRLPMTPLTDSQKAALKQTLTSYGLLS